MKKISTLWKSWDDIQRPNQMGSCTNNMSKCKNQTIDSSLSTNMHKHIKKLWFAQRNMEFNWLMLNIHIHRMLQLRKCVRLLWFRHALCVQDWPLCSMVFWPPQSNKLAKLKTLPHWQNWHQHIPTDWQN